MYRWRLSFLTVVVALVSGVAVADWPQWRGPSRAGYIDAPPLLKQLPAEGLAPVWKYSALPGGNSGGWSSPVISGDRVYVYSHTKNKSADGELAPKKFPWLAPDKRTGMTDEEYAEYEVKRRDEDERRAKAYRFVQKLACIDLNSGDVIWEKSDDAAYSRFVQSGTPCVAGGRVFVLGPARIAYCYDAGTGDVLWKEKLPGEFRDEFFASSFVVAGETALVACGPLVALNVSDGQLIWKSDEPADYHSHSSPVIWRVGETSVAICNVGGGRTQAYQIANGKKLWELKSGVGQSTPVVAGDMLLTYGSSRKNGLTAYRLMPDSPEKEPEQAWQFRGAADSGSTPVVRGDYAFVQGDKRLAKVNLQDGDTAWQTTLKISNPRYTSLIAVGDQIFYGWEGLLAVDAEAEKFTTIYDAEIDSDGNLIASDDLRKKLKLDEMESEESEKVWQSKAIKSGPLACSTPASSDGRIVIRLQNSLVCYDLRQ